MRIELTAPEPQVPAHHDSRASIRERGFENPFRRVVERARAGNQGALDDAERQRQAVDENPADVGRRRMR
ncbi:hypothetical protein CAEBREN_16116 [Caenorhabditis brenneri]|uniref:Uncharacterized protein n=1 Tax=Caenorhabditis brenneri TaxID=135651 RepID=G0MB01_CAEBE|nr:hypothetical protein CAEBREN_16116 [Caenorhabditis brenneri]